MKNLLISSLDTATHKILVSIASVNGKRAEERVLRSSFHVEPYIVPKFETIAWNDRHKVKRTGYHWKQLSGEDRSGRCQI